MFALKRVFDTTPVQKVWFKVEKEDGDEKLYSVFFIAARTEAGSPFIGVRLIGSVGTATEFFTGNTQLKEFKFTDSQLAGEIMDTCSFQYWYMESSEETVPETVISTIKEYRTMEPGAYEMKDGKPWVIHMRSDLFTAMFEADNSRVLADATVIRAAVTEYGVGDRPDDEMPWRPEDAPSSYKPLLVRLIRAEVLKVISARHPAFTTELPFCYGGFYKGAVVNFCKQNDLFFGTLDNVAMSYSEAGGRTIASVSGIISIRDALKLSGMTLDRIKSADGISLGFDFVNPVEAVAASGYDIRFDWRRCCRVDPSVIGVAGVYSEHPVLSDVIGLQGVRYDIEGIKEDDIREAFSDWLLERGINIDAGQGEELRYDPGIQAADIEPGLQFDTKLFRDEVLRVFVSRALSRINDGAMESVKRWMRDLRDQMKRLREEGDVNTLPKRKREYEANMSLLFSDLPGDIDKETEWLYRVVPLCSGLSEAGKEEYADKLSPRGIFQDNAGEAAVIAERDTQGVINRELKPLSKAMLGTDRSVGDAARELVRFIDDMRRSVKPYVVKKQIEEPEETIDSRGGDNG